MKKVRRECPNCKTDKALFRSSDGWTCIQCENDFTNEQVIVWMEDNLMIEDKRKLWLMTACSISFTSQDAQSEYAEKFIKKLNHEEVDFCIKWLENDYEIYK